MFKSPIDALNFLFTANPNDPHAAIKVEAYKTIMNALSAPDTSHLETQIKSLQSQIADLELLLAEQPAAKTPTRRKTNAK